MLEHLEWFSVFGINEEMLVIIVVFVPMNSDEISPVDFPLLLIGFCEWKAFVLDVFSCCERIYMNLNKSAIGQLIERSTWFMAY